MSARVKKDVMLSDTGSDYRQHYKEFCMEIDLVVPARTRCRDYVNTSTYKAEEIRRLIELGYTMAGISRELNMSKYIVKQVLQTLGLRPQPKPLNYLQHPKVSPADVRALRQQNKTFPEIAHELGVQRQVIRKVVKAIEASTGERLDKIPPRARMHFPSRVNYLKHPHVQSEIVAKLLGEGKSLKYIADSVSLSQGTIRKVVNALGSGRRRRYVDFLNHPRCPVVEVSRLQRLGLTQKEIARQLRISVGTLQHVLLAMKYRKNE